MEADDLCSGGDGLAGEVADPAQVVRLVAVTMFELDGGDAERVGRGHGGELTAGATRAHWRRSPHRGASIEREKEGQSQNFSSPDQLSGGWVSTLQSPLTFVWQARRSDFSLPRRAKKVIGPVIRRNHSKKPCRLTLSSPLTTRTRQLAQVPSRGS